MLQNVYLKNKILPQAIQLLKDGSNKLEVLKVISDSGYGWISSSVTLDPNKANDILFLMNGETYTISPTDWLVVYDGVLKVYSGIDFTKNYMTQLEKDNIDYPASFYSYYKKEEDTIRPFEVGDIVVPQPLTHLRSGSETYDHAIVIKVNNETKQIQTVSIDTDMTWTSLTTDDYKIIGKTSDLHLQRCMIRLKN